MLLQGRRSAARADLGLRELEDGLPIACGRPAQSDDRRFGDDANCVSNHEAYVANHFGT